VWDADILAGHDNQVLADPERLGVVEPVAADYFTGLTRLLLRFQGVSQAHRLDLIGEAGGTVYGDQIQGEDSDLRISAAYGRRLSPGWQLSLNGTGWRFRRGGFDAFDTDRLRAEAGVSWILSRSWLGSLDARQDWVRFPGVYVDPDSMENEQQRQLNLTATAVRDLGRESYLSTRFRWRQVQSNLRQNEYESPEIQVRGRFGLPSRFALLGFATYGRRNFLDSPASPDTGAADRKDDVWLFGITLERRMLPRVDLFLDVTFLHQVSNAESFTYDQTRLTLGISYALVPRPAERIREAPPPRLSPRPRDGTVEFPFRDPGATRVFLVGDFNGWDPSRTPLAGPDGEGRWSVEVPLGPGVWRYAFVVDGTWIRPPDAPRYEEDGFGGQHGVLELKTSQ
jgi:hypothetical protein